MIILVQVEVFGSKYHHWYNVSDTRYVCWHSLAKLAALPVQSAQTTTVAMLAEMEGSCVLQIIMVPSWVWAR